MGNLGVGSIGLVMGELLAVCWKIADSDWAAGIRVDACWGGDFE